MKKIRQPIHLRSKKMLGGGKSLYLDYQTKGQRHYEFLHLYLIPESTPEHRRKNADTLALAEEIRARRILQLREREYGITESRYDKRERYVLPYFKNLALERISGTGGNHQWGDCYNHLNRYLQGKDITFNDLTPRFIESFRRSVEALPYKQNTKWGYFTKFCAFLNQAVKDGLVDYETAKSVKKIPAEVTEREYLTIEELRAVAALPFSERASYRTIERMFLFGCFTGLRFSDIRALTWAKISTVGKYTRITFTQQKTGKLEYLDISPEAVALLGERGKDSDSVFGYKTTRLHLSKPLREWVMQAGITKPVTFHSSRHTFAMMMIELGVDLYTTSRLLGHRKISTTQIYAAISDNKKRQAIEKIPKIFTK